MTFDVKGFDFHKQSSSHNYGAAQVTSWKPSDWQYGYDADDMAVARGMGASDYQLGQLRIEANRRGLPIRGKVTKALSGWDAGLYDASSAGNYGFGMADVRQINDLEKVKEYSAFASSKGLNIGAGVQDWISDQENQLLTQAHNTEMASIAQAALDKPVTINRSGNPGAVGKPAAGMKIAKGDDYSGGRRGAAALNRDSAYFINNLGGVNSSNTNNMGIT